MSKSPGLTESRLNEILRRQDPPEFGLAYEAAIKATREEAPSNCRPAYVWSEKLGRDVSTLSKPEREVLSIVLYCSMFFELHEQRMLPIVPSAHPLHGHPLAQGLDLPQSRGTFLIARDLHHLRFHPIVTLAPRDGVDRGQEPGCFVGDFLLFIKDRLGPFCINLNVKSTRSEFSVPQVGVTVKTDMERASAREVARHELERRVYEEIGIPTIEVAADELPQLLVANLRQLLLWQKRKHDLSADQLATVVDAFNEGLQSELPALEVMRATELTHTISAYEQKIVLYQAIFNRRLRVDLFESHFFIDRPMKPETQDPLVVFGHWFRRQA
jgi:hypothetical protein